ncbi:glycosyltransferase [Defluviicoccus vanus]|uniref:Glycosyltransferase n=1 Tax=Defluviicoccus vanus TaxID=111831 RepID=A0A7H1N342_9PROT|nr:glycosyltransferase [Defluviicoccus vanus]QNT70128.1 glycosyltransferase [Defluviicoccus vanus]
MSARNCVTYVEDALDSILRQSFKDWELIVIDDGSSDGTSKVIAARGRADKRVRAIYQESRGLVASLNRGLSMSRGRYVARMDADDISTLDRIEKQVLFMERNPQVAAAGGAVKVINATGDVVGRERFPIASADIERILLEGGCPLCHPTVMMRADIVHTLNGYRSVVRHAEDFDLWLRMADRFELSNLSAEILFYRRHTGQVSVRRCGDQALSNLAARAATVARRSGRPDPLDCIDEITPATLKALGLSEPVQRAAVNRASVVCISSMIEAREYTSAGERIGAMLEDFGSCSADRTIRSDLLLLSARFHLTQGKLIKAFANWLRALRTRPIVLLRPLKHVMSLLGLSVRFDVAVEQLEVGLVRPIIRRLVQW